IDLAFDGNDITITHQDTSDFGGFGVVGDSTPTTMSFVRDVNIGVDTFGHVTSGGATLGSFTLGDGITTITASSAGISLTGDSTWSANQTAASTFNIAHADTSNVGNLSSDNSNNVVIQDIAFTYDTFGHVTDSSVATKNITTVTNSSLVDVDQANGDTNCQVGFFATNSSGYSKPYIDTDDSHFVYNPSTTLISGVNLDWSDVTGKPSLDNYANWRLYVNSSLAKTVTSTGIVGFNAANAGISLAFVSSQNVQITNTMYANNTGIKDDSRNTLGVTRLYRNDSNDNYSVQNNYDGSRWFLRGYSGDSFHAECRVGYADSAGSVAYGNVSGTPTIGNGSHTITENSAYMTVSNSGGTFTANDSGNTTDTITLNATSASTVSTVVARDVDGDINARLFRSEYDTYTTTVGAIMVQHDTGTDNYLRPSTPASVRAAMGIEAGATADQNCFMSIPIYSPGPTHQGTAVADGTQDSFSMFSGTGITLSTSGDNVTITNTAPHAATNLSTAYGTSSITIASSTGSNTSITEASGSAAGL
ncbi:MAG: hypothetical protein ACKVJK_22980, partial [Methylophagaceae bacterium]